MDIPPPAVRQGTWGGRQAPLYTRASCVAGRLASSGGSHGKWCWVVVVVFRPVLVVLFGEAHFPPLLYREPLFFVGGVLLDNGSSVVGIPGLAGIRAFTFVAVGGGVLRDPLLRRNVW